MPNYCPAGVPLVSRNRPVDGPRLDHMMFLRSNSGPRCPAGVPPVSRRGLRISKHRRLRRAIQTFDHVD
eukprot:3479450-Pyramimonas_sp.AAC.1